MEDQGRPERLYREPEDRKVAGVCSGLADYFGFDPTIVRLAFVVVVLASGFAAVVAYVVAAMVVPARPDTVPRVQAPPNALAASRSRNNILLIGLLVVASATLVGGRWSWWWFEPPVVGALLVAMGIWLLYTRAERPVEEIAVPFATPSDQVTTLVSEPVAAGPQDELPPPIPPWGPAAPFSPPPPERSSGTPTGVVAALLIVVGVVALLSVFDVWDLSFEEALGAGLVAIGALLVVGAWFGWRRGLLVGFGLPMLATLVLCDTVDLPLDAGSGERDVVVTTLAELEALDTTQELLAGELVLDLSEAPLGAPGTPRLLAADVGIGNLEVILPDDVDAELRIEVGIGNSRVDGHDENGVDIDRREILDGSPGGETIELDLHVGLGEVEVTRG